MFLRHSAGSDGIRISKRSVLSSHTWKRPERPGHSDVGAKRAKMRILKHISKFDFFFFCFIVQVNYVEKYLKLSPAPLIVHPKIPSVSHL